MRWQGGNAAEGKMVEPSQDLDSMPHMIERHDNDQSCQILPRDPVGCSFAHRMGNVPFAGAPMCMVCKRPFTVYMLLDTSDPRLGLDVTRRLLPVLYCHNCETTADVFMYQLMGQDDIRVLHQHQGVQFDDWPRPHGEFGLQFTPIPDRVSEFRLRTPGGWYNSRECNTPEGQAFAEEFLLGDRPYHQLKGAPFWLQDPRTFQCPECARDMPFLLSMASDSRLGWEFGDGGWLYVFLCTQCAVVACVLQCT
jgi:hypothetical protein